MGWGLGNYCKSMGKTLRVQTQHLPQRRSTRAPRLLFCRRKHMGRCPAINIYSSRCHRGLGERKTWLQLQRQVLYRRMWPLHAGMCTFSSVFALELIVFHLCFHTHIFFFAVTRLCGQAATRLVAPFSCAPTVLKNLQIARVLFSYATTPQRKFNRFTPVTRFETNKSEFWKCALG